MIDFGHEANLWSGHGILLGQEKLELEHTTFEGRLKRKQIK